MKSRLLFTAYAIAIIWFAETGEANHIPVWNEQREIFKNIDCAKNNTCDLKEFTILKEDFKKIRADDGKIAYATRMFAEYETDTMAHLANYGIVHFIQGCMFESWKEGGKLIKHRRYAKFQSGKPVLIHFSDWTIDSIAEQYLWNPGGLHNRKKERIFSEEGVPLIPRIYAADIPGAAFVTGDTAKNISLKLKVCIYKKRDIPESPAPRNVDFAEPIHCFSWESSFIYDHVANRFETKKELDPFCLEKVSNEIN